MSTLVVVEHEEQDVKTFRALCFDRKIAPPLSLSFCGSPQNVIDAVRAGSLHAGDIACVLMDLALDHDVAGDRSGLNYVTQLRRTLGPVPIIAFTLHCEDTEFADMTAHDIDGILMKQDFWNPGFGFDRFRRLVDGWRRKKGLPDLAWLPSPTSTPPVMPTVLHISDLQFGRGTTRPFELADAIGAAVKSRCPNIVVVSGDVAQSGSPDEYSQAADFLQRLCRELRIDEDERHRVILVPGNHDISWLLSLGAYVDENLGKLSVPKKNLSAYRFRFGPFVEFLTTFYSRCEGITFPEGFWGFRLHDLRAFGLVVLAMNSSLQEGPFDKGGSLTDEVLEQIKEKTAAYLGSPEGLLAAVFHHPLRTAFGSDSGAEQSDAIADAATVAKRLCRAGIRFVFTGHIHTSNIERIEMRTGAAKLNSGLINLLAGSVGLPSPDLPRVRHGPLRNQFNIFRALKYPEKWELEVFELDPESAAFIPVNKFPGESSRLAIELLKPL